jgi:hypothetical protein
VPDPAFQSIQQTSTIRQKGKRLWIAVGSLLDRFQVGPTPLEEALPTADGFNQLFQNEGVSMDYEQLTDNPHEEARRTSCNPLRTEVLKPAPSCLAEDVSDYDGIVGRCVVEGNFPVTSITHA